MNVIAKCYAEVQKMKMQDTKIIDSSFSERQSSERWRIVATSLLSLALLVACGNAPQKQETATQDRLILAKRERGMEMWKARCQKSGESIRKTLKDVQGIYLINVRTDQNLDNQFALNDPYGLDLVGDGYIETFLQGSYGFGRNAPWPAEWPAHKGYRFVEAKDPRDGQLYRYTGRVEEPWQNDKRFLKGYLRYVIDRAPINERTAQFGVRYDDISTREEREYWIAASSLKVVDLSNDEVIAERVGYMVDWAQGSRAGGRSPWLFAADNACPDFDRDFPESVRTSNHKNRNQPRQAQRFVEKVLKPLP